MSTNDLVKELKATIADITKDRDDALANAKTKESRIKQLMIKLEHSTADVHSCGHKIGELNREIATLEAKLDTKQKLLDEALQRIKDIHDDSTQVETQSQSDQEEQN
jgi:peptidoglycan hydrolase CwlO-like protein